MDVKPYLERINYGGAIDPTLEVLSNLQFMHLMSVPFENLDIQNNIKIDLTNLFDKIVTRRRGGFCYELNGLFYELLKEIGFTVKLISARVYDGEKDYSPEYDHMALVVKIENEHYLVDVGFGDFLFCPIKVELSKVVSDPAGVFIIETFDEKYKVIKKKDVGGNFIPEYIFSEKERKLEDFYPRCNYHQTNKESHFMQKRICSLPTESGRITLSGSKLKITVNGVVTEWALGTEQEMQNALWNCFGIKL